MSDIRNYSEAQARDAIAKLSRQLGKLDESRAKGPLTAREAGLKAEIEEMIHELNDHLEKLRPVGGPVTRQGSHLAAGQWAISSSGAGFQSLGEQLLAIRNASIPGNLADPRLYQTRALGLNETVPSDSGFLVQTDFSSDIIMSAFKGAKVAPLCKKITISNNSNSVKINAIDETSRVSTRSGGVLGYWLPEAGTKLPSQPKFRQIELNLKKICVVTYATDEVLQDVSVLNTVIRDAMVDEITFRIDDAIINGTGAGMPLGIIPSGAMISVAKQTGQQPNTIVAENIFDMWARLLPGSESDAVWFINKNVVPQLYSLNLAVGTGGVSIYTPANSIAGAPYQSLMGRPVIPIEQCPTLGTVGDIILADMRNGYVLADKGGVQVDMSIHIAFLTDESCFRAVYRVDACPVLSAPITPFKGSSASHFVAIATRSL